MASQNSAAHCGTRLPYQWPCVLVSACCTVVGWQHIAWPEHDAWLQGTHLTDLTCAAAAGLEGANAVSASVGHWLALVAAPTKVDNEAAGQSPSLSQRQRPSPPATTLMRVLQ